MNWIRTIILAALALAVTVLIVEANGTAIYDATGRNVGKVTTSPRP